MQRVRKPVLLSVASALLVVGFISSVTAADKKPSKAETALADSMQRKIDHIKSNSAKPEPEQTPTIFTEEEVNAYFAQRRLKMPDGVKSVIFDLQPEFVHTTATIDFDEITRTRRSNNPLLGIFTGIHEVKASAFADGAGGMVNVEVESVKIDGVPIPKMVLKLFIERWVNPKYPNVKLNGSYKLPSKMDTVIIERDKGTVTQK